MWQRGPEAGALMTVTLTVRIYQ